MINKNHILENHLVEGSLEPVSVVHFSVFELNEPFLEVFDDVLSFLVGDSFFATLRKLLKSVEIFKISSFITVGVGVLGEEDQSGTIC